MASAVVFQLCAPPLAAAEVAALERQFTTTVKPLLAKHCLGCHGDSAPAAQFNLKAYHSLDAVVHDFPRWELVLQRTLAHEMPPRGALALAPEDRRKLIGWIEALRAGEIRKNAGDPGPVLARRLSHSEYDYTIRDLTGVDLRPAREFPVDPANQAGFDNSAESLMTSPGLMAKYLEAARRSADHLVLTPTGMVFSPWPALVETDREKYAVRKILDFYARQPTDFCGLLRGRLALPASGRAGTPNATLATVAARAKLSSRYLAVIWQALEHTPADVGPLAKLQAMWRQLPAPVAGRMDAPRARLVAMRDYTARIRRHTEKLFDPPSVPSMNANFQPFMMWRNREIAAHRRDFDRQALRVVGEPAPGPELMVTRGPVFGGGEKIIVEKAIADYLKERREDPDLVVPAGERTRYEAAFAQFSSIFPTAFYLRERGRFYPVDSYDQGRYLGAGFHSVTGYFRDDAVLSDLILDEAGQREMDALWREFEFVADFTGRTWEQFLFNGGGGSRGLNIAKPSFGEAKSEASIFRLRDQYVKAVPAGAPR